MDGVTPLAAALYMASATSLTVGVMAAGVWLVRRGSAAYGWFGLAAVAFGAATFTEPLFYGAASIEEFVGPLRWQIVFLAVFLGSFTWFLKEYCGVRQGWLGYLVLGVLAGLVVLNFLSPHTLLYAEITGLRPIDLPWGPDIVFAVGRSPGYWPLINLPGFLIVVLFVIGVRRMWRIGERRRAVGISFAFVPFAVAFWVVNPLTELGVIDAPYMSSFAYLAVVLLVGYELGSDVVRAAVLTDEVREGERRWRSLLDNVELFVTEVDGGGRITYVNPYYTRVTGWAPDEVIGRRFTEMVPEADRAELDARFEDLASAESRIPLDVAFRAKNGRILHSIWASVPLLDAAGELSGVLSVGSDVTDRRQAEEARDEAIEQLEDFKRQLEEENVYLRHELELSHGFEEIVGDSDALKYVLHRVEQVAATDTTVLIEGETGVGKELVARAIHERSSRSARPFITVNCGALPANLVESELFGHERGAFTGATGLRKGRFELADRGTVFLDEIGDLPLDIQVKLLRVLQEGSFERVGSSVTRNADIRVIAATNRNLESEVAAGRFREDLFYRLYVYPLTVPPLRDRREDIPLLVHHLVRRIGSRIGKAIEEVPGPAIRRLSSYDWPGNVRELENVLERAVILSPGRSLTLPQGFDSAAVANKKADEVSSDLSTLAEAERAHIEAALQACSWRIEGDGGAASVLGLHPSTLRSRMKKHEIKRSSITSAG